MMPAWAGSSPRAKPSTSTWVQTLAGGLLLVLLGSAINLFAAPGGSLLFRSGGTAPPPFIPLPWNAAWEPPPDTLDLTAPVALSGLMTKHGPSDMVTQLAALADGGGNATLGYPLEWRKERLAGRFQEPPIKWCAVMFNDKYRLIFLKCPKTAGTPLLLHFGVCIPGALDNKDTCLTMIEINNHWQLNHLKAVWPYYFVFGFTRNILARAVSQYKYLTHFMAKCPLVTWDDFCRDPFVLGSVCYQNAREGNPCCQEAADHQYTHAAPQSHCFTTSDGKSAVDWLGRMEHLDAEFEGLITLLNSRPDVPKLPSLQAAPKRVNYNKSPCQASSGGGGRRLASDPWEVRDGTFNPCDPLDYFRGPHAHCYSHLLQFFHEDVQFLQPAGDASLPTAV